MKAKFLVLLAVAIFLVTMIPTSIHAGYSLAITGASDFTATPYQAQVFSGPDIYVKVHLSEYSPTSLVIDITTDGTLSSYITFPDYTGTPSFTLYPGQSQAIRYNLSLPASAPGKYTGTIMAIGTPPLSEISDGTGAIGKPVAGITLIADVPTEIQIYNLIMSKPGGFPDTQWATWGNEWSTNFSLVNGGQDIFNGSCNLTLSDQSGVREYENFTITNLSANESITLGKAWQNNLPLYSNYIVNALVFNDTGIQKDEEAVGFHIPSPAEIISVTRTPQQVFFEDTVAIYATAASSDSILTLNFQVNNGTETTSPMTYSSTTGEYSGTIPSQAIGSMVYYWVTSINGAFTDRSPSSGAYSYYVFSPDVPDLTINEDSYLFTPIDPFTQPMNETNTTVIYLTIRNIGRGSASDIPVRIYDGETAIWNGTIPSLAGDGGSDIIHYSWRPLEGEHILRFVVDPDAIILELDENNNHYTLDPITIHPAPPYVPPVEPPQSDSLLPYIVIPIILVLLFLVIFFLRRKKTINVTVSEIKPFKHPKEGTLRWKYTCSYGDNELGSTKSTALHAEVGTTIQVKPIGLYEKDDGAIIWSDAEVKKILEGEEPDTEPTIRKLIKKENRQEDRK